MPVKIKYKLAAIKEAMPKARLEFIKTTLAGLGEEINAEVSAGKSPVAGYGRFKDYSEGYKEHIQENEGIIKGSDGKWNTGKRIRPVNLFVSGKMQKSQKVKEKNGIIEVSYSSPLAQYHNTGTTRGLPARPILPSDKGDLFSRTITKYLYENIKKAIYKVIKK